MTLMKEPFENIMWKGENAGNQHFLLFPCFLPFPKQFQFFSNINFVANALKLDQPTILLFCKELKPDIVSYESKKILIEYWNVE